MLAAMGALAFLFAIFSVWGLYKALANKEIALPARGGGTYWLRASEKPAKFWVCVVVFALAVLMSIWLGVMMLAGCETLASATCMFHHAL